MPSLEEVFEKVKFLMAKGDKSRKCHFGLVDVEAKERRENPKGKTRFIMETDDPLMYAAFNEQKDRYLRLIPNKSVALSILHERWSEPTDEEIADRAGDL